MFVSTDGQVGVGMGLKLTSSYTTPSTLNHITNFDQRISSVFSRRLLPGIYEA
jgi:hypothetical protein